MQERQRTGIALWRVGVLGPLVSAELEHGDLKQLCKELAARTYQRPDGERVTLSPRTIEDWHYQHKKGGWEALKPAARSDKGTSRAIPDELADKIIALKREKPRRSVRRIIKMLVRDGAVGADALTRSSVHRLLKAHDLSERPVRTEATERRAFRHAYAGDCLMGDVLHGPKALDDKGEARKVYLHLFIDSATRFITACAFRLGETAADFESVLKQSVLKHGIPRILYVDNGAAQTADSLALICAELGIYLRHCRPYDPAAKAGVERVLRTVRDEVLDELPSEPIPVGELNGLLWSWVSAEYHQRQHGGTERQPLEHWLSDAERLRPAPTAAALDAIFLHRDRRKVAKDGTIRFKGARLEVRAELTGQEVELRFSADHSFDRSDPSTFPSIYDDVGNLVCDTVLLDVVKNSRRTRRVLKQTGDNDEHSEPTGIEPLQQIADEHARRTRSPKK